MFDKESISDETILDTIKYRESLDLYRSLKEASVLVDENSDDRVISFYREKLSRSSVKIAYLILTDHCNFGCSYCFVKNNSSKDYKPQNMSPEVAKQSLRLFSKLTDSTSPGETSIILYGGEPLMNLPAVNSTLEEVNRLKSIDRLSNSTSINLITNGSLLTDELAKTLCKHGVKVSISLDGNQKSTDSCRKTIDDKPVFKTIIDGIKICQNAGLEIGISCTLSPESLDDFEGTVELITEELGIKGFGFNLAIGTPDFKLPTNYAKRVSLLLIKAFSKFRKLGIYEDRIMRKVEAFSNSTVHPFDCGASGSGQLVFAPDGQIGVCHGFTGSRKHFTNFFVGKNTRNFSPEKDPIFIEWRKRSPLFMDKCQNCSAIGICGGGCPFQAEIDTGSIWGLDERFCIHSKITMEWLIWDLYESIKV
jgi:uncharacterized protein